MKTLNITTSTANVKAEGEDYNDFFGPYETWNFKPLCTLKKAEGGFGYELYVWYRITADHYIQFTNGDSLGGRHRFIESQYLYDQSLAPEKNLKNALTHRIRHRARFEGTGWANCEAHDYFTTEEVNDLIDEIIAELEKRAK